MCIHGYVAKTHLPVLPKSTELDTFINVIAQRAEMCLHGYVAKTHLPVLLKSAWTLRGGATAFDAELSALVQRIELCVLRAAPGVHFRIFTDSQAAMSRLLSDRPGPGQQMAIRGIIGATRTYQQGASISID